MGRRVSSLAERKQKTPANNAISLLQITDCHLGSKPNETLLGMDTDLSLRDVLAAAQSREHPDLIMVSGDISNDGGPMSYARFLKIVDEYFPRIPVAWLPGNHDDVNNMISIGVHPIEHSHQVNGWNLIMLNSRIPFEEGGRLGKAELDRLERQLEAHPDLAAAVFLHHQVVPVGSEWVDQYLVEDCTQFFDVIDRFPQVKFVAWGHVHQAFSEERNGVELIATPSTCVQFTPNSDEFKVDTIMPGYRSFKLFADGQYSSVVERAEEREYCLDIAATGY
jgi:Icc protein